MATVSVTEENVAEVTAAAEAEAEAHANPEPVRPEGEAAPEVVEAASEKVEEEAKPVEETPAPDKGADETPLGQLDMEALATEFAENEGTLSDKSRDLITDALTKGGIPDAEAVLDQYLGAVNAQGVASQHAVFDIAGGQETYTEMLSWAGENLSPQEQAAFNNAVQGDLATASLAARGLFAQYTAATGASPGQAKSVPQNPLVKAGPTTQAGLAPIKSMQQLSEIQSSPEYDNDPAFRAEVDQRVAASLKAGWLS